MIDNRSVGRCLSEMRKYFRITQDELAARLNVSRQAVSKWETGASVPDIEQLLSLSELFGVSMNDILRGDVSAIRQRREIVLPRESRRDRQITVIGAGRWGCFIAWYLDRIGHHVTLVGRAGSKRFEALRSARSNEYVTLPESILLTDDETTACQAEIIILAIPSQELHSLADRLKDMGVTDKIIVLCMKGIEVATGRRLSQVITDALDHSNKAAVWVGPGHVEEFVRGVPNCMVIDSSSELTKQEVIRAFSSDLIRFYYGQDLIGSEIGAAAKNVIGIAAGILDGLDLASLKGALMSRGTSEIARLIVAMGGEAASAYGLCHLGDYEATLFSPHSHNRAFGEAVTRGQSYHALAEGYATVKALRNLGKSHGVELPICEAVYQVVCEGASPAATIDQLFTRSLKNEF
ncbi:MAG: NAD(P)H-dependent glycerol-3-phosphate dehydrogenase [Clostridiales bacterium]|nr:NAD(P)H-dependent glycerol-3-phosphate dehydrogenase [Clostridiales bacterium]